jgi:hypothetical protein
MVHQTLTKMQADALENHLVHGMNKSEAARKAGYSEASAHAHNPIAKRTISEKLAELDEKYGSELNWKVAKLRQVAEVAIPDEELTKEDLKTVGSGIEALKELNKMRGHYSPEKLVTVNMNVDLELEESNRLLESLLEQHTKDI